MKLRKWSVVLLLMICCLLPCARSEAASKAPRSIRLSRRSASAMPGKKIKLRATVSPKGAVKWSSSNASVATVNQKGLVTIHGLGSANITAKTANGKKAVCKVTGTKYVRSGDKLTIATPEGIKTYTIYHQGKYGLYYGSKGCVVTALAIAASAYGKRYTPKNIHDGSAKAVYSERYAVKKMNKEKDLKKCFGKKTISVYTASEILTNMGIPNRPVYSFDRKEAEKEIREHLKQGKPVIIKANTNRYRGIRLAQVHHALVLVGLDSQDRIIYVNPGMVQDYKIKLSTLLQHHMTPAKGNYMAPYMTDIKTAGGYILVG